MPTTARELLKKQLVTIDTATALANAYGSNAFATFTDAKALIYANPNGLTVQEALDALADEGALARLYEIMTNALELLASLYPSLAATLQLDHTEVVSYTADDGAFRMLATNVPFSPTRERYPHQPDLASAEAFVAQVNAEVTPPENSQEATESTEA